jgi:hypothetical protein
MKCFITNDDAIYAADFFDSHIAPDGTEMLQLLQVVLPLQSASIEVLDGHRLVIAKRAGQTLDFAAQVSDESSDDNAREEKP